MRKTAILMLLLGAFACGDEGPSRPGPPPDPPAISALSIAPDTVVTGAVTVTVTAVRADSVSLWLGDSLASVDQEAPYHLVFHSEAVPNGERPLLFRAANAGGTADTTLTCLVGNPEGGVYVLVRPRTAHLLSEDAIRFSVDVLGTEDDRVVWSLEPVDAPAFETGPGSMDENGFYTAPVQVPPGAEVLVRATSLVDTGQSAVARVSLEQGAGVRITQAPAEVVLNRVYPLAARTYGTSPGEVVWSVAEGAAHGTIDAAGVYHAPAVLPYPRQVTFCVASASRPDRADSTKATILYGVGLALLAAPDEVVVGQAYQLAAAVHLASDKRVRWSLDEGPAHGTVDANGLYHAPETRPDPPQVTFRVTSLADTLSFVRKTAVVTGPPVVTLLPEDAVIMEGGVLQLQAQVAGVSDSSVLWSVMGGPRFGSITTSGRYTAPDLLPDPPRAEVRAISMADRRHYGVAWVDLIAGPPPSEDQLVVDMFHASYEVTALAEQVTGVAATLLGMVRYLSGDDENRTGLLEESTNGWFYSSTEEDVLEARPLTGGSWRIRYEIADGVSPASRGERRFCRGAEFQGELVCTIVVDLASELRLTNSSRPGPLADSQDSCSANATFERTLQGVIPGADGGRWKLDLGMAGTMGACDDTGSTSTVLVEQSLTGSFTTPAGWIVAVDTEIHESSTGSPTGTLLNTTRFEGDFSVTTNSGVYAWSEVSLDRSWALDEPENLPQWRATGSVRKDQGPYGEIRFEPPLAPDLDPAPDPVLDLGYGRRIALDRYWFRFDDPSGPARSPFSGVYW